MSEHKRLFLEGKTRAIRRLKPEIDSITRAMENGRSHVLDPYMRGYQKGLFERFVDVLKRKLG